MSEQRGPAGTPRYEIGYPNDMGHGIVAYAGSLAEAKRESRKHYLADIYDTVTCKWIRGARLSQDEVYTEANKL